MRTSTALVLIMLASPVGAQQRPDLAEMLKQLGSGAHGQATQEKEAKSAETGFDPSVGQARRGHRTYRGPAVASPTPQGFAELAEHAARLLAELDAAGTARKKEASE